MKVIQQLEYKRNLEKYGEKNTKESLTVQGQDLDLLKFVKQHADGELLASLGVDAVDDENDIDAPLFDRDEDMTDVMEKSLDVFDKVDKSKKEKDRIKKDIEKQKEKELIRQEVLKELKNEKVDKSIEKDS